METKTTILFEPSAKQQEFMDAVVSGKYNYLLYAGSIRSGKTYCSLATLIFLCSAFPESRWAVVRESLTTLKKTTIPSFDKVCPKSFIKNFNQDTFTVTFQNNSQIIFFSEAFDDDKLGLRFRGLEVNGFLLEESNEMQFETFNKCIERSGSHIPGHGHAKPKPIVLLTCNPCSGWVKEVFYDRYIDGSLPPDFYFQQAAITDNPWIASDPDYMASLKNLPTYEYKTLVEGIWGLQEKTGSEFHRSFDLDLHTGPVAYDPKAAIILSWDENANPYLPVMVLQIVNNQLRVIKEITGMSPNNKVEWVCGEFTRLYPDHCAGLIITGDATSQKQDTKIEAGYNYFRLILDYLKHYHPILRLGKSNPSVVLAGRYMDVVFEGKRPGYSILIGSDCNHTIEDMVCLKTDPDGTKHKTMFTDPKTKIRCQKYGHFSDCLTYALVNLLATDYIDFQYGTSKKFNVTFGKNVSNNDGTRPHQPRTHSKNYYQ